MHDTFSTSSRRRAEIYATEKPAGVLAAAAWLEARGLRHMAGPGWDVAISLEVVDGLASPYVTSLGNSRFHVAITATEWGFFFCHRARASWIRVTDVPFVHEYDDHGLIREVPPLRDLGRLVQMVEQRNGISFRRKYASIRTNLIGAEPQIRTWITSAL